MPESGNCHSVCTLWFELTACWNKNSENLSLRGQRKGSIRIDSVHISKIFTHFALSQCKQSLTLL
jgi:hypothetical protein